MEKLLPQNIEAECGVLGSILLDPEATALVAEFLYPEDFYRDAHRTIYETVIELYQRHEPADFITICDALSRKSKLGDVGGDGYITSLVNQVPTSGNVEYYGRIVERTATLRRLIHAAGQIAAIAYEEADAETAITASEELIYQIAHSRQSGHESSLMEVMHRYIAKLERLKQARKDGHVIGLPTGFYHLDQMLAGLQPSDLITLAARPGVGKSSLALAIARYVARVSSGLGHRVLIFSLEMSEEQLASRLLSMETGIDQTLLRTANFGDDDAIWDAIVHGADQLSDEQIWIDDTPTVTITQMRSRARRIQSQRGVDLIIVDYMQLARAVTDEKKSIENRLQEVSAISRGLKAMAREIDVPVLALAQLSRAVEQRAEKIPQLSDLRESGTIEADSDIVILLYQDQQIQMADGRIVVNALVAKQRNGPTGTIPLIFQRNLTEFTNPDDDVKGA